MDTPKLYTLPKLGYEYNALAPVISEDLLKLHHDKHHSAYVNGANTLLQKMDKARTDNADFDTKATFKELSFHSGGHLLHSLFWENLAPAAKTTPKPTGKFATLIERVFGSVEHFKKKLIDFIGNKTPEIEHFFRHIGRLYSGG